MPAARGPFAYAMRPRNRKFFGYVHQILPLASGAVGASDPLQIDGSWDFHFYGQTTAYQSGMVKVQFQLGNGGLFLSDVPQYISSIGMGGLLTRRPGNGRKIPTNSAFTMFAWDRQLVAQTANIRVLNIGEAVFPVPFSPALGYHTADDIALTANFTADDGGLGAVGANSSASASIVVPGNYDFDIYSMIILCTDTRATIQVNLSGPRFLWFNRACHAQLLGASTFDAALSSGSLPFRFPHPIRVMGPGAINVDVADLSAASNRMQIIFLGKRLQPAGGIPIDARLLA